MQTRDKNLRDHITMFGNTSQIIDKLCNAKYQQWFCNSALTANHKHDQIHYWQTVHCLIIAYVINSWRLFTWTHIDDTVQNSNSNHTCKY